MKNHCTKTYMYTLRKTVISPSRYASFYSTLTTHTQEKIKSVSNIRILWRSFQVLQMSDINYQRLNIHQYSLISVTAKRKEAGLPVCNSSGGNRDGGPGAHFLYLCQPPSSAATLHCHPSIVELLLRHHLRKEFC